MNEVELIDGIASLQQAFDQLLYFHDIVAEQNFWCCQTCGRAALEEAKDSFENLVGFCFYHQQNSETLMETGETYLYHGAYDDSRGGEVARTICDVLEEWSFDVSWNGDPETAIKVKVFEVNEEDFECELNELEGGDL